MHALMHINRTTGKHIACTHHEGAYPDSRRRMRARTHTHICMHAHAHAPVAAQPAPPPPGPSSANGCACAARRKGEATTRPPSYSPRSRSLTRARSSLGGGAGMGRAAVYAQAKKGIQVGGSGRCTGLRPDPCQHFSQLLRGASSSSNSAKSSSEALQGKSACAPGME